MEGVGKATCAQDTRGQGGPRGHARGAEAAGDRQAGRGGGAGVRAAAVLGQREGQHLRNPPPAAVAAASLRPGELSARPARLPARRQPPAALAPRRRAAAASGGAARGPGLGVGRRSPAEARATPWSSALAPLHGQVSGCGDAGRRPGGGR